jgi:hypothetical protein
MFKDAAKVFRLKIEHLILHDSLFFDQPWKFEFSLTLTLTHSLTDSLTLSLLLRRNIPPLFQRHSAVSLFSLSQSPAFKRFSACLAHSKSSSKVTFLTFERWNIRISSFHNLHGWILTTFFLSIFFLFVIFFASAIESCWEWGCVGWVCARWGGKSVILHVLRCWRRRLLRWVERHIPHSRAHRIHYAESTTHNTQHRIHYAESTAKHISVTQHRWYSCWIKRWFFFLKCLVLFRYWYFLWRESNLSVVRWDVILPNLLSGGFQRDLFFHDLLIFAVIFWNIFRIFWMSHLSFFLSFRSHSSHRFWGRYEGIRRLRLTEPLLHHAHAPSLPLLLSLVSLSPLPVSCFFSQEAEADFLPISPTYSRLVCSSLNILTSPFINSLLLQFFFQSIGFVFYPILWF